MRGMSDRVKNPNHIIEVYGPVEDGLSAHHVASYDAHSCHSQYSLERLLHLAAERGIDLNFRLISWREAQVEMKEPTSTFPLHSVVDAFATDLGELDGCLVASYCATGPFASLVEDSLKELQSIEFCERLHEAMPSANIGRDDDDDFDEDERLLPPVVCPEEIRRCSGFVPLPVMLREAIDLASVIEVQENCNNYTMSASRCGMSM